MKTVFIIIGPIGLLILMFMGSVKLLAIHICNRTDCDRFNIDNVELRTGIDIPNIQSNECNCSEGLKSNTFVLDLDSGKLERYIQRNKFIAHEALFINKGETEYSSWSAIFNPSTNELKIDLSYKN
ncbi:MAG: hypothetical protein JKY48_08810 [Flavobacteriales bacterium]|nr:hypothetical protein [Flavobacteriales bacterium]